MTIFVDQSGQWGGGEFCLYEIVSGLKGRLDFCIFLFETGPFFEDLTKSGMDVLLADCPNPVKVRRSSGLGDILRSFSATWSLVKELAGLCDAGTVLYANSLKAVVVCLLVSSWKKVPVVWHLRDILSEDHFSRWNRRLLIFLSNRFCAEMIANSQATLDAYRQGGGRCRCELVYNALNTEKYRRLCTFSSSKARSELGLPEVFTLGLFGRIAEWKGQDVLIRAIESLNNVHALIVGDALFTGDEQYHSTLLSLVKSQEVSGKVSILGFKENVPLHMAACDIVVHTSTMPEPFGRVIIEAMCSKRPVIATCGGGAAELVGLQEERGWLCEGNNVDSLKEKILEVMECSSQIRSAKVDDAYSYALENFSVDVHRHKIVNVITRVQAGSR